MANVKAQVRLRTDIPYKLRGDDYILLSVEFEVEDWDEFDPDEQEQIIYGVAEETMERETGEPYVAFQIKRLEVRGD